MVRVGYYTKTTDRVFKNIDRETVRHNLQIDDQYISIPTYSQYREQYFNENLNYVERFDGFGCYDRDCELKTVGKIIHPCSELLK